MDPGYYLRLARHELDSSLFPADTIPGVYPRYASNISVPGVLVGGHVEYRPDTTWMEPMVDIYERDLQNLSRLSALERKRA